MESREQTYYDFLKRITKYDSVEKLRRNSEKDYGLPFHEALEYAYENIIHEAKIAVWRRPRPKDPAQPANRRTKSPLADPNKGEKDGKDKPGN